MKWFEKIKSGKGEQILIFLLAGILLLVIAIPAEPSPDRETVETETAVRKASSETEKLEERLKQILGQVEGIGRTEVMITLKSDGQQIVEKDLEHQEGKEESQNEGNTGSSSQINSSESTVYQKDSQGNEIPYVTERISPEISGVLVIAQGGGNPVIANEITEAVMALFGVEAHKIKVMKME